jgi:hypothetical protein
LIAFEFARQVFQNPHISNFLIICPVKAELFCVDRWTDRQADMIKLIVAFHNFANMPKSGKMCFGFEILKICHG